MKKKARSNLDQIADQIRACLKRQVSDVILIGDLLQEVKDKHLKHGEFLPWLKQEFELSESTAQNFMAASTFAKSEAVEEALEKCGKSLQFADLKIRVSALYFLAKSELEPSDELIAVFQEAKEKWVGHSRAMEIIWEVQSDKNEKRADEQRAREKAEYEKEEHDERCSCDFCNEKRGGPPEESEQDEDQSEDADPSPGPPPPAPLSAPTPLEESLTDQFVSTIQKLKKLSTKPAANFVGSPVPVSDLETVVDFLGEVIRQSKDWPKVNPPFLDRLIESTKGALK
jgi:hypothetical protein